MRAWFETIHASGRYVVSDNLVEEGDKRAHVAERPRVRDGRTA
jgi:hypothetical protein